jgi:hypothetical protein
MRAEGKRTSDMPEIHEVAEKLEKFGNAHLSGASGPDSDRVRERMAKLDKGSKPVAYSLDRLWDEQKARLMFSSVESGKQKEYSKPACPRSPSCVPRARGDEPK